jgi:DNA polymerase III delta prime subunit
MADLPAVKNLWCEEFRPKTLSDCLIPPRILSALEGFAREGNPPHLVFHGPAGSGKTTAAKCLAADLGAESLFFNASDESKKDQVMAILAPFASTVSLGERKGAPKIAIADEAERLEPKAQDSLKGFLEQVSANCRLIMTANSFQMLIPPLRSRSVCFDFSPSREERGDLLERAHKRCAAILKRKGVRADKKALASLVVKLFPDFRRILNSLQSAAAAEGEISSSILDDHSSGSIAEALFPLVLEKDFTGARKAIGESLWGFQDVADALFSGLDQFFPKQLIPQAIVLICDYSHKNSFAANPRICALAMIAELMGLL